ncbi:hypothetical protein [Thomasclavelia ramosa]|nr:hypothetical protein [Thomasclavelia ramosa]
MKVLENNMVQLPSKLMAQLMLKVGDSVLVEWNPENLRSKCFSIKEDNEEDLFNEGFYCIPDRVFEKCEIPIESVQIIMDKENITITTSSKILESLGNELLACIIEQDVDFAMLADDLVDCINDGIDEDDVLQDS